MFKFEKSQFNYTVEVTSGISIFTERAMGRCLLLMGFNIKPLTADVFKPFNRTPISC